MKGDLMNKEKRLIKEKKKKEKKIKKKNQKRTKELKSILDWMDIQSIDEYGIYLQKGNKKMIARGLVLSSNNIFLKDSYEKAKDVYALSSALDRLKGVTYFKFVKTPIRLSSNINRLSEELVTERVAGRRRLIKQQIDKMEWAMEQFKELSFYVMVQDRPEVIDKRLYALKQEMNFAGLSPQLMGITDYEAVISQQFENETVNEYMYSTLVVDQEVYQDAIDQSKKARRTTIAPKGMLERNNYYILGDTYVRVLTVTALPNEFGEGFLAQFINDSRFHIDFSTKIMNEDVSSFLQKEINELETKIDKCDNDLNREILIKRYRSYQDSLKQMVANNSRTINTVINLYIHAKTFHDLEEHTKELKEFFYSTGLSIRLDTLPRLQVGAMQKNSPLFIGNTLNRYSDYHIGLMMPSLSVAGLWPFIFDSMDDKYGSFIGVEANTGGKIVFDQFAYLNDKEPDIREEQQAI